MRIRRIYLICRAERIDELQRSNTRIIIELPKVTSLNKTSTFFKNALKCMNQSESWI